MKPYPDCTDNRHQCFCIHCERSLLDVEVTKDHVPGRAQIMPPYPQYLKPIDVCRECNSGFARDEEYFTAFLATVISGSVVPDPQRFPVASKILAWSAPLRERLLQARRVQWNDSGESETIWIPEMDRVHRVIVKNARGHVRYELGQAATWAPTYVNFMPLVRMSRAERNEFEAPSSRLAGWPEMGSRLMQRIAGSDILFGGWLVVQQGIYRYAVDEFANVRIVLQEYLAAEVSWAGS